MLALVSAALLVIFLSLGAHAQSRTITVYAERPDSLGATSTESLQQEMLRLLAPARVKWVWKDAARSIEFNDTDSIAVGSFDGVCSVAGLPMANRSPDGDASVLGHTSISNGRVLPFFRVDCGSILRVLTPALRSLSSQSREEVFGRALGRVVAHEIYHVLSRTTQHQTSGVAKPVFSLNDLTAEALAFERRSAQLTPAPSRNSSSSADSR
jgi:hypothetical protein